MKVSIKKAIFVFCVLANVAVAVEEKVIVRIGDEAITNFDIYERKAKSRTISDRYFNANGMESILQRFIEPYLFEQYLKKQKLSVSDQDVMESWKEELRKKGVISIDKELQRRKTINDNGKKMKDWDAFKSSKRGIKQRRAILNFDPGVSNVTEEDIQEYLKAAKDNRRFKFGVQENISIRSISVLKNKVDNDPSLLKELEKIRQRVNDGEKFEDVVMEYFERAEFDVQVNPKRVNPRLMETGGFKRQGKDALFHWSELQGKAVLLNAQDFAYFIWVIDHYMPDTRTTFKDALKSEGLRQEALKQVSGFKYQRAKSQLLEKLKKEMVLFVGDEYDVYNDLADQYESWWIDTFKDAKDFQKRLKDLQKSQKKHIERQIKKAEKQKKLR